MPKTKRTHLKEPTFNKAKELADLGLTNNQLISITGYSLPTVCRIKQAKDWSDYQTRRKSENLRQQTNKNGVAETAKQDATKEKPVAQTTDNDLIKDLFTIVQEQSEIIKRMDSSLTWLAEHAVIQSVTTKRRFF